MDRQTEQKRRKPNRGQAVEHYWQKVGRHNMSMLGAHTSGSYDAGETDGQLFNRQERLNKTNFKTFYEDVICSVLWMDSYF